MMAETAPKPGTRTRKASAVVVPHKARWQQRLMARLIYCVVWCVNATIRYEWHDHSGLLTASSNENVIFAVWHNRLALVLPLYRRYVASLKPERRLAAMVSASRDGGLLARILELFDAEPVRGSSSRRGPQALREMISRAERGYDLALTPDGPRGPRYEVQEGAISAAQLTGLKILPASYHLNWKICAKSWDRFQIPLPFARCQVIIGEPIVVPREATEAQREVLKRELEDALKRLTRD